MSSFYHFLVEKILIILLFRNLFLSFFIITLLLLLMKQLILYYQLGLVRICLMPPALNLKRITAQGILFPFPVNVCKRQVFQMFS